MKVCVVGASGVLGRTLIPLLLNEGHTVRALARFDDRKRELLPHQTDCVSFDLLSPEAVSKLPGLLRGYSAVLHIATAIPANFAAPGAWDLNTKLRTDGTRRLLDAAIASGVEYYLQQSITMAYPNRGDEWIDETVPLDKSPERAAICSPVIAMESMVKSAPPDKIAWVILRGGTFVGPGTFQDSSIKNLRARSEVVPGEGKNYISPIHVADMASAFVSALQIRQNNMTLNIVAEPIRFGEYLERLASQIGANKPIHDKNLPEQPSNRCSNQRTKSVLKWSPVHSILPTV
jgi:nucleoside-diphosphate-sugar epimerase